jgi:predicted transcriptional regulator
MPENFPSHHHAIVLRACRHLCGMTRQELADASGVSVPAIARIELAEATPRRSTWKVLIWTFGEVGVVVDESETPQVSIAFDTSLLSGMELEGGVAGVFGKNSGRDG